jgi:hypothetical protein
MLSVILIAAAIFIGLFVIIVATRPSDFRYTRAARIAAPPEAVFAHVNDFHKWNDWSPWAKMDPNCKNTFSGPDSGQGATFAWAGNNKVGEGRMTILESRPSELVRIKLEFFKPFKATNTAEFTFKPEGGQTQVTWIMFGPCNFFSKAFGLFMDCEKMVGGQFEQGLANLNSVCQSMVSR